MTAVAELDSHRTVLDQYLHRKMEISTIYKSTNLILRFGSCQNARYRFGRDVSPSWSSPIISDPVTSKESDPEPHPIWVVLPYVAYQTI